MIFESYFVNSIMGLVRCICCQATEQALQLIDWPSEGLIVIAPTTHLSNPSGPPRAESKVSLAFFTDTQVPGM